VIEKGHTIPCLDHGFVRLIDYLGTEQRIVEAARVSYKSPSKGDDADKKLIAYLYKNRHTSPFEQCNITYNIKLPLFVQGQLVRHRTQRLNQMSARYTEMPDEFYIPSEWRPQDTKNKQGSTEQVGWNPSVKVMMPNPQVLGSGNIPNGPLCGDKLGEEPYLYTYEATAMVNHHCKISYQKYESLLHAGVAKEMSRMILPQNLYTEIYSNWDLHNLMHMFTLRLDAHAQLEIRVFAQAMFDIFEALYPWVSEAYKKYTWVVKEQ